MAKTNPTQPHDDELLSAYVDGELTDDQRALVEQRLREDPAARDLVDALRAISQTMQSLPRHTPDDGFRETVLRKTAHASETTAENNKRAMSLGRHLFWPGLAVAAALMLMVYQSQNADEHGPLADATRQKAIPAREVPQLRAVEGQQEDEAFGGEPLAQSSPSELNISGELSKEMSSRTEVAAESRSTGLSAAIAVNEPNAPNAAERLSLRDESAAVCEIHITLNRTQWNSVQFDRLLRNHGIAVRGSELKSNEFADAAGGGGGGRGRVARLSVATEKVLVEAPPAQIEAILAECYADKEHCFALSITTPPGQKNAPTERWRRLQLDRWEADKPVGHGWQDASSPDESDMKSGTSKNRATAANPPVVRVLFVLHWQKSPAGSDELPQAVEADEK